MKSVPLNKAELLPVMKKSYMFRHLTEAETGLVLDNAVMMECLKDEKIIVEHEPSDSLYLISAGSVRVTVTEKEKEVYICTLGEGDVFGEAALFVNLKRTANVVASDDGIQVLRIRREDFMKYLKNQPSAGIKVLFMIIFSLLRKLREANMELAYERKDDAGQDDIDKIMASFQEEMK
jgi:CRP-like cAMP-binding protein